MAATDALAWMNRVRCPACAGDGCDEYGDDCRACGSTGAVPACVECHVLPIDALFAPCCGGSCREAWERTQPQPIVKRAP